MAIIDKLTEFCDATSVAAAAGTALVGSQVDLSAASIDLGQSQAYLNIVVDTAVITGGVAGTVTFVLASDDSAAIATNGSASEHFRTKAFVTNAVGSAELQAGTVMSFPLPAISVEQYERYLGILVVTATTTTTAGAISAWIGLNPLNTKLNGYADASN